MTNRADLEFLAGKTKLSFVRVKPLTEEPRDLQLLLNEISKNISSQEELSKVSLQNKFRIIFYKFSQDKDFSLEHKTLAADIISNNYEKLKKRKNLLKIQEGRLDEKFAEKFAQYYFSMLCLHEFKTISKTNHLIEHYLNYLVNCFALCGKRDFSRTIEDWIKIVAKIKKEKWI